MLDNRNSSISPWKGKDGGEGGKPPTAKEKFEPLQKEPLKVPGLVLSFPLMAMKNWPVVLLYIPAI